VGVQFTGIQFELFVSGYLQLDTHVIGTSIECALMASFSMFPKVLKTYGKHCKVFHSKSSQKTFFIPKFVVDQK